MDREENINFVLDYVNHHFDTNVIVYETGEIPTESVANRRDCRYIFDQNSSGIFHNTKIKNNLVKISPTKVVALHDCDCIVSPHSYITTTNYILNSLYSVVYPYDGKFMECGRKWLTELRKEYKFDCVPEGELNCLHPNSVGGIVFVDREKFLGVGGYSEKFISWGFEDDYLWLIANHFLEVGRLGGNLLHIDHFRGSTSSPNHEHYRNNMMEFYKMKSMTKEQLKGYLGI